jgi:hypothetical protein
MSIDEPAAHPEGLSLGQDLPFERRWWTFQRALWTSALVLVGLGVAGAFGRGPLSSRTLESKTFKLRYSRVERLFNAGELEVVLEPAAAKAELELTISSDHEACLPVDTSSPEPLRQALGPNGRTLVYRIDALEREQSIRLSIKPKRAGGCSGRVMVGNEALDFKQLILP